MNSIPICNLNMRSALECKAPFLIFTNCFFRNCQQLYVADADNKVSGSVMVLAVLCWRLVSIQAATVNCTVHLYLARTKLKLA